MVLKVKKLLDAGSDLVESHPDHLLGPFKILGDRVFCFSKSCEGCKIFSACQSKEVEISLGGVPNLRSTFCASPGHKIVSIDYKSMEVRIAANLANESVWIEAFNSGDPNLDIHRVTAAASFNKVVDQVSDYERKLAKAGTFCAIFGGGAYTLARNLGIDEKQAREVFERFFAGLTNLKRWMDTQRSLALERQYVETIAGRRRSLRRYYASADKTLIGRAGRIALNHPVQGSAAEIIKIAMARVHGGLRKMGWWERSPMILTIHDELLLDANESTMPDEEIPFAVKAMRVQVGNWRVPMDVDVEVGDNWGATVKYAKYLKQAGRLDALKLVVLPGNPVTGGAVVPAVAHARKEVEATGFADLHLEGVDLTLHLIEKVKKAAFKCPGTQVVRLYFDRGADPVEVPQLGLVDGEMFRELLME